MKNRDTIRNLAIAGSIFVIVLSASRLLMPEQPPTPLPGSPEPPALLGNENTGSHGVSTDSGQPRDSISTARDANTAGAASLGGFVVMEAPNEQTRAMGSAQSVSFDNAGVADDYRMRLTLSNVGASIESATMTDHARDLGSDARYELLSLIEPDELTRFRSLAVEKINVDNVDVPLADRKWHVGSVTETDDGETIRFHIEIQQHGQPALRLTRTFSLPRQEKSLGRHDLESTITVENLSTVTRQVVVTYRGGLGVAAASTRMDDRYIDCGIFDGTRVVGTRHTHVEISGRAGDAVSLYKPARDAPNARLSWAATANTYFTCTIAPRTHDGQDNPSYLAEVSAIDLDGSPTTTDDATLRFVTGAQPLSPSATVTYPASIYLGEKDGNAFRDVEDYNRRNYYYQISQGFGWCTFNWLVELMIWLLNTLFWAVGDYGLAIIILVMIVRTMLHPITKKGQVNMIAMQQRMGEFAPQIEELKRKYGNDKAKIQQEQMKLYREHGVNPAGQLLSCLPMMLQMPIWVALFLSLSNNIQIRHQPLHFTWVHDLTAPDALITFSSPLIVPLLGWEIPSFNLLPLLVSVFMYTQQKLQPRPKPNPNATEQQRQQQEMMQKMMPMMSIMMLLFFYNAPSGLNLYIMFSSMFGTYEQHRIRKHIKAKEEAGTLHKTGTKGADDVKRKNPKGPSFFERLQKMADEAQKAKASSRKPGGRKGRR